LGIIQSNEQEMIECNAGSFEVLGVFGNLLSGSYAHAFTSLSPVAGNQARVNHLIRFEESMSNPTNEPSREPIREQQFQDWNGMLSFQLSFRLPRFGRAG